MRSARDGLAGAMRSKQRGLRVRWVAAAGAGVLAASVACGPAWATAPWQPSAQHGGVAAAPKDPGYLGIAFHDLTDDDVAELHLKGMHGAEVEMVDHDGPAGQAGLCPQDVIVKLNGQAVDGSVTLRKVIHEAGAGAAIALEVWRGGKALTLHAQLADRGEVERAARERIEDGGAVPPPVAMGLLESGPDADAPMTTAVPPGGKTQGFISSMLHTSPYTGLEMGAMQTQLAGYFGAPPGMGLLVSTVMAGSPAADAGIRAGDVVLRADAVVLRTTGDWAKHLRETRGAAVHVTILRDRHEQVVTLVPDGKKKSAVEWPWLPGRGNGRGPGPGEVACVELFC
jgi:serine protease Do